MIEKEVIVASDKFLRARYVSELVNKTKSFKSNMYIIHNYKKADVKSLINVFVLEIPK